MNRIFTLLLAATAVASATAEFVSDGSHRVYTFQDLSSIDTSGVVKQADGSWVVNSNFTIAEGDTLRLLGGEVVKLANDVTINIDGFADLTPADTATITRSSDDALPNGFKIYGDNAQARLKHVHFEYVGISFGSNTGNLQARRCTFDDYNGQLATSATLNFSRSSHGNVVDSCTFRNGKSAAIGNGANTPIGITISNSVFYHNNTGNSNRPQLNMVCAGDYDIVIRNNVVTGGQFSKVGGIGVSNLLSMSGTCKAIIELNEVTDNRYGIGITGPVNTEILDNRIVNNKYETNPMNGGSGISVYSNSKGTFAARNHIEGNLWGVTIIGNSTDVNFGRGTDESDVNYNEGLNTFVDNGNGGVRYEFYNNSANTVYAQHNNWNVASTDSADIETVVFHKADNPSLGEVIFMPAANSSSVQGVVAPAALSYQPSVGAIVLTEPTQVAVWSTTGAQVAQSRGKVAVLDVSELPAGVYVARTATHSLKFLKR